jgi:thymidylate synthase ThyX
MNFVEPSVTLINNDNPMNKIERAYRICYKSEDRMTNDSAGFINNLLYPEDKDTIPHTSPLAHVRVELIVDAFVADYLYCWQGTKHNYHIELYNAPSMEDNEDNYWLRGNLRAFFDFVNDRSIEEDTLTRDICRAVGNALSEQFPLLFNKEEMQWSRIHNDEINVDFSRMLDDYYTFHIVTTRDVLQQIARHTTLSLNVESTRYCNYGKKGMTFVIPRPYAWCNHIDFSKYEDYAGDDSMGALFIRSAMQAEYDYNKALELGYLPEEARMVLPGALKTELIATGTDTAWKNFIKLRCANEAHPQTRYIADMIRKAVEG